MKKTLLFTTKTKTFITLLVFCLCINFGWSQTNLVLNGTCSNHTIDVNDNADSFDMTPPSTIDGTVSSPYNALWNNSDLDSWLGTNCGNTSEQPGSTSDGNKFGPNAGDGRGVKISSTCRRLYQVIAVTPGTNYTFSIDSRSEAANVPSEVFILNQEIVTESGLENGSADSRVDAFTSITNDFNATKSSSTEDTFTTTTFTFTASASIAVIYVRASAAVDNNNEVFYDNISLSVTTTASVKDDEFSTYFSLYPNPASSFISIQSKSVDVTNVQVYNLTGQLVLDQKGLVKNGVDVSSLNKGVYILKLSSNNNQYSTKIVVE